MSRTALEPVARSRRVPLTYELLVAVVMDRLALVAHPAGGEPSPLAKGGPPEAWARAAGLEHEPMRGFPARPLVLPTEPYPPEDVARAALQRLVERVVVEWAGPGLWRPVARR